jgi:hypothetical protein
MKIYTLTIIKETYDEAAKITTTLYASPEKAIEAYGEAFDEARAEAAWYEEVWEDDEIATDTPYRWWAICDLAGSSDRITIELDTKEVNGSMTTYKKCPNCGFNPEQEPYCMEATHCPKCGYNFGMSPKRTQELYDNMLFHISELVSGSDLVDTLHAIGFTDEEIASEGFDVDD